MDTPGRWLIVARNCRGPGAPRGATALLLDGGHIVASGPARRLLRVRPRGTRVVHLPDCTLTPGLVDCHTHFFYWALGRALVIEVAGLPTLDATVRYIARAGRRRRVGDWIVARGFDQNVWGTGWPTAADLDAAIPDTPVLVRSRDGHSVWLNSAGLRAAGITAQTPDPPAGRYLRDVHGRPTGIVQEAAIDALPNPVREFAQRRDATSLRRVDEALGAAYAEAHRHGLTAVHTMDDAPSLHHLQRQAADGTLGLRVMHAVPYERLREVTQLGLRSGLGDAWLRLGGMKFFADGALGSQTAYMFDDYPDRPGHHGVPVVAGEELRAAVAAAAGAGWAVWIHAIGDRAVHEAVAAIAAARPASPPPLPHRIEHAQCVRPADVRRMARAGIIASMQPCHIPGDIATANRHWPRARRNAYPIRRMLDAGVAVCFGSDVPIESLDPRRGLWAATQRVDDGGAPAGGWFAGQRTTTAEALYAYTRGAAASVGLPPPRGTLAAGPPADQTVWRDDPLALPAAELRDARLVGCVVGGHLHLGGEAG